MEGQDERKAEADAKIEELLEEASQRITHAVKVFDANDEKMRALVGQEVKKLWDAEKEVRQDSVREAITGQVHAREEAGLNNTVHDTVLRLGRKYGELETRAAVFSMLQHGELHIVNRPWKPGDDTYMMDELSLRERVWSARRRRGTPQMDRIRTVLEGPPEGIGGPPRRTETEPEEPPPQE